MNKNIFFNTELIANAQHFNLDYKRRCVKGAVACFIGRCVRSVAYVALDGNPA